MSVDIELYCGEERVVFQSGNVEFEKFAEIAFMPLETLDDGKAYTFSIEELRKGIIEYTKKVLGEEKDILNAVDRLSNLLAVIEFTLRELKENTDCEPNRLILSY